MTMNTEKELINIYPYWLVRCVRALSTRSVSGLKKAGIDITVDQWMVLLAIENFDGESQRFISKKTLKDTANVYRIVSNLIKKGLIKKNAHPNDGRKTILNITEKGKQTIEKALPIMHENRCKGLEDVSEKEFDFMMSALKKIYHSLEEDLN